MAGVAGKSGRKHGSRNRVSLATEAQIKELKKAGTDPKDYIIGVMAGTHEFDAIKMRAAETLMEFYYPKLARQEIKGQVDATLTVVLANSLAD